MELGQSVEVVEPGEGYKAADEDADKVADVEVYYFVLHVELAEEDHCVGYHYHETNDRDVKTSKVS